MKELFFTSEQKSILDIQMMFPNQGVCNIAGVIYVRQVENPEYVISAMRNNLEDIEIFHLQVDKDYRPYISDTSVSFSEWESDCEPTEEELTKWLEKNLFYPDIPLYEARYFLLNDSVKLYIKLHHIVMDGYSVAYTVGRFWDYYDRELGKLATVTEHNNKFVELMESIKTNSVRDIQWFEKNVPDRMPDSWIIKKTNINNIKTDRKIYPVCEDLYIKLKKFEVKNELTCEAVFAQALAIYLAKISGSPKVCFGRSMVNRRKNEMQMPGMKANQLPVFVELENVCFSDACKKTEAYLYDMMRHSSASFMEYLNEHELNNDFYDTTISYRSQKYIPFVGDAEQKEIWNGLQEIPLRIFINEFDSNIRLEVQYQREHYDEVEIDMMVNRLFAVLSQGMDDAMTDEISVLCDADMQIWQQLNADYREVTDTTPLLLQIKNNVENGCRNLKAVIFENESITYEELWNKSDHIAARLVDEGVESGDIVGVWMHESIGLPVALMGIWKAGAAFLPIGPGESESRVAHINEMCRLILTDELCETYSKDKVKCENTLPYVDMIKNNTWESQIAYYMHTSGSTGTPKAVKISHKSLAWRVNWMKHMYGKADAVLQNAAYTFDVSMWEFFLPLISGGTLCLLGDNKRSNPNAIAEYIMQNNIDTLHFVPAMLTVFINYIKKTGLNIACIKNVFSSGEALPSQLAKEFHNLLPGARLHNLYGPTECTIDVTYHECNFFENRMPIGRPLPGTQILIVDDNGNCVPVGIEGELVVYGVLVGEGYYNFESEKYKIDELTGAKVYYTGDRAYLGFDGEIYYCGRRDRQCKINGIRVDLNQIEDVMLKISGVLRVSVIKHGNNLVAGYMSDKPIKNIESVLSEYLPAHSIPSGFVWFDEIPFTQNGKTDSKFVEERISEMLKETVIKPPNTAIEKQIYDCVSEVLKKQLSVDENLFLAGLDSLGVLNVIIELESKGLYYTTEDFYSNKTIEKIAQKQAGDIQWLTRKNNRNAVIAFPYAAGSAGAYEELAELLEAKNVDFGVTHSCDIADQITDYDKIILVGYCTGTVLALEALEALNDKEAICGLVLCAALPPSEKLISKGSPWDRISKKGVATVIRYLHRTRLDVSDGMIESFRRDSRHFITYFKTNHRVKCDRIFLAFGGMDALTLNAGKNWRKWKDYLAGHIHTRIWKGEHHFFLDTRRRELSEIIIKMFMEE